MENNSNTEINKTDNTAAEPAAADKPVNNITNTIPDNQPKEEISSADKPMYDYINDMGIFAYSQKGENHINSNKACQDKNKYYYIEDKNILICAVADGINSQYKQGDNAECAVIAVVNYLTSELKKVPDTKTLFSNEQQIKKLMQNAMDYAEQCIIKSYIEANILYDDIHSDLTFCLYDGKELYFAHSGDSGVIAVDNNGSYKLINNRWKDNKAAIDKKEKQYEKADNIASFIIATDGLLDSFIKNKDGNNCVDITVLSYIFTANLIYEQDIKALCENYYDYTKDEKLRNKVKDDITLLAVNNSKGKITETILNDGSPKTTISDKAANNDENKKEPKSTEPPLPKLELPPASYSFENKTGVFAFSQKGQSHIEAGTSCQDRCGYRYVEKQKVWICAIADGVGSCAYSDYGSTCAVNSALDIIEKELNLLDANTVLTVEYMGKLLRKMMQYAYDSVKQKAVELGLLLYSMQSTLTVAVYDGNNLYFSHAGDDGIVVLQRDGKFNMITVRHKGEESSSVYPLQSVKTWQYGMTKNVHSFIMATDGVLDAFVKNEYENNRIYLPFIQDIFTASYKSKDDVKSICDDYFSYMSDSSYRKVVKDDLTLIGVTNSNDDQNFVKPVFSKEEWNKKTSEYAEARKKALYSEDQKGQQIAAKTTAGKYNPVQNTQQKPATAQTNTKSNDNNVNQPNVTYSVNQSSAPDSVNRPNSGYKIIEKPKAVVERIGNACEKTLQKACEMTDEIAGEILTGISGRHGECNKNNNNNGQK